MLNLRQTQDYLIAAKQMYPSLNLTKLLLLQEVACRIEVDTTTLAAVCHLDKSVSSKATAALTWLTVDKTEGLGLLEATLNPADLRTRLIRLTPKGRTVMDQLRRISTST